MRAATHGKCEAWCRRQRSAAEDDERAQSDTSADPFTGADLGAGWSGKTTDGDQGGAADVQDASKKADALAPER
jgi:hypothetical protein